MRRVRRDTVRSTRLSLASACIQEQVRDNIIQMQTLMIPSSQISLRPLAQQTECGEDCEVTVIAAAQDTDQQ